LTPLVALVSTIIQSAPADRPAARSNVLLIISHDQARIDYSFMGHPHLPKPYASPAGHAILPLTDATFHMEQRLAFNPMITFGSNPIRTDSDPSCLTLLAVRGLSALSMVIFSAGVGLAQPAGEPVETTETFQRVTDIENVVVRHQSGKFTAWPANNGLWRWDAGADILVGFTSGRYVERNGHKIADEHRNGLARSTDGGLTWSLSSPTNYADDRLTATPLTEAIDFNAPGFALRVCGMGYHGNTRLKAPCLYYSYDRGHTWKGPFLFGGLDRMREIEGSTAITPRTDYLVLGPGECLVFASATTGPFLDKTFVIRTTDGGMSFSFLSWVVPRSDPYRAVMSQTVRTGEMEMVSVLRRRDRPGKPTECWIDAFGSRDGGESWSFRSRVAYTGFGNSNGNPPAMTRLQDGRLLVVYGNRSLRMILCRLSADGGRSWGREIILRDDFLKGDHGFADFGYPRVTQRADGKVVALYYFATETHREQHIACSIFSLEDLGEIEVQRSMTLP
jgi:hypothetical protein